MNVDFADMTKAAAIVGLVASIGTLVDLSASIVSRLHDFTSKASDIPDSFRSLSIRLPLLSVTLKHIRNQAEAGRFPNDVARALNAVIESISTQVSFLQTCLFSIIPPDGAPKLIRVSKALKSMVKEDKVRQALEQIHKSIEVLVLHQTTRHTDIGDHILEELSRLNVLLSASSKSFGVTLKDLSQRSPPIKAAQQSGSGHKLFGENSSSSKTGILSESYRAFHATVRRQQNPRTLSAFCSLTKLDINYKFATVTDVCLASMS